MGREFYINSLDEMCDLMCGSDGYISEIAFELLKAYKEKNDMSWENVANLVGVHVGTAYSWRENKRINGRIEDVQLVLECIGYRLRIERMEE